MVKMHSECLYIMREKMGAECVQCLSNSISRFIHSVSCSSKPIPCEKDYRVLVRSLEHLKVLLHEATKCSICSQDDLFRECNELDAAVNESSDFVESWCPTMSKLRCIIEMEQLVFKVRSSSLRICHILETSCQHFAPAVPTILKQCNEVFDYLKLEALKMQSGSMFANDSHLVEIAESLGLTSSEEILKERISLESTVQTDETNGESYRIKQMVYLLTRMAGCVAQTGRFEEKITALVPVYFRCPLSLEFMGDPVIVASGQTYERGSMQKWFDSGLTHCPKTGQHLEHTTLIPNHAVRAMILNWCEENNVMPESNADYLNCESSQENSSNAPHSRSDSGVSVEWSPGKDRSTPRYPIQFNELVQSLKNQSVEVHTATAAEIRWLTKANEENRRMFCQSGAISPILSLMYSRERETQEHAVTALLNISISDENKLPVAESGAVEPLIHVLRSGSSHAKENSAAALFSLSCLDEYRVRIGRSEAVRLLVELLGSGSLRGKKDAATALFSLSICHENKVRIVQAGAVKWLVQLLDPTSGMADKSVAIMANLATVSEGQSAIAREGGIPLLVEVMEAGSERGKENAACILLHLCIGSGRCCAAVLEEGAVPPLVALSTSGTPRAREKAQQILSHFRSQREAVDGKKKR